MRLRVAIIQRAESIGSSWFDLALLEECQLLTKEEVLYLFTAPVTNHVKNCLGSSGEA